MSSFESDRYSRQALMPQVGPDGQRLLGSSSALVLGCGALGCVSAELLVRAGVGTVVLTDRDFVERSNLQRQLLYSEADADQRLPKAEAARRRLVSVNRDITIEAQVVDVTARNVGDLVAAADVVVDGTDNVETRYLLNDACVQQGVPWIYGGAVGVEGLAMAVLPGQGPCLRCAFPEPPAAGSLPTCDTAGVLGSAPAMVAALQASLALQLLLGERGQVGRMISMNVWKARFSALPLPRSADCPCCVQRGFVFLRRQRTAWATSLCGRNAVQITPPEPTPMPLESLARSLQPVGEVRFNGLLLTLSVEGCELVAFPDGRVVVRGTTDQAVARGLVARYLGS